MTPVERAARAVKAELRKQDVLWEDGEAPGQLMMQTGSVADLDAVIRAVMQAIREPSEAMVRASVAAVGRSDPLIAELVAPKSWQAMIDAALSEVPD